MPALYYTVGLEKKKISNRIPIPATARRIVITPGSWGPMSVFTPQTRITMTTGLKPTEGRNLIDVPGSMMHLYAELGIPIPVGVLQSLFIQNGNDGPLTALVMFG